MRRRVALALRGMASRLDPQAAQTPQVTVSYNSQPLDPEKVAAALRIHARRNGLGGLV